VPKFCRATPPNSEVISAPLLHFKPIFDSTLKKVVKGAPVPSGGRGPPAGCTSKTWSFSSACKNLGVQHPLGAEIWSSKKCALGGTIQHLNLQGHWTKLHRTCFAYRRRNRHRRNDYPILNIFIRFGDIRR